MQNRTDSLTDNDHFWRIITQILSENRRVWNNRIWDELKAMGDNGRHDPTTFAGQEARGRGCSFVRHVQIERPISPRGLTRSHYAGPTYGVCLVSTILPPPPSPSPTPPPPQNGVVLARIAPRSFTRHQSGWHLYVRTILSHIPHCLWPMPIPRMAG